MAETVQLPEVVQRQLNFWWALGALVVCAFYGWFSIVRDAETPVLEFMDVAVHEVGHELFSGFGELIMLVMGSGFQVLFPFVLGIAFGVWKRNLIAWGVCWAWAANAMCDAARYIYDAPRGELTLLGASDGLGDWSRILGPEHYDKLYLADRLAANVRTAGIITWCLAVVLVVFALTRNAIAIRRGSAAATARATAKPSGALAPIADVDMWRR